MASDVAEIRAIHGECKHVHDGNEWKPRKDEAGKWYFSSHEEAEYTAHLAFGIAVSLSWWAVRVGKAKLYAPRMPKMEHTGCRVGWADLPPEIMR